jgi:hypothetical protein
VKGEEHVSAGRCGEGRVGSRQRAKSERVVDAVGLLGSAAAIMCGAAPPQARFGHGGRASGQP